MAGRLKGKVAIVTGASRGLGHHCAVGFGRQGANVAVAAGTDQGRTEGRRGRKGGRVSLPGGLKGKVAIVTGASRGLGQHCAVGFAREGATVVIAARTEQETNPNLPGTIYETARLVEEAGGEALPVVCNVADNESVQAMVRSGLDRYGRGGVLMTKAAVQPPGGISDMQIRHWELAFRVNVHGTFYCIRAVLPSMLERGSGNIITISSVAARGGSHHG